jgi:hypothetical protein
MAEHVVRAGDVEGGEPVEAQERNPHECCPAEPVDSVYGGSAGALRRGFGECVDDLF